MVSSASLDAARSISELFGTRSSSGTIRDGFSSSRTSCPAAGPLRRARVGTANTFVLSASDAMPETMLAAVFAREGCLELQERRRPHLECAADVLIEVEGCGICGTDLHIL